MRRTGWHAGFGGSFGRRNRSVFVAACALLPAAILPPFIFVLFPAVPSQFESRAIADGLVLLLLLLPAIAALAAARIGLRRIVQIWGNGSEGDLAFDIWRICVGLMLFAGAATLTLTDGAGASCALTVAGAGLVFGWLLLLFGLRRAKPRVRFRLGAIATDALLLSAFLHFGGGAGSAALPLYLMLILANGWQFGLSALAQASAFSIGGFAAVSATTGFWQDRPALAAGVLALLTVGAAGAARLLRAIAALRRSTSAVALAHSHALAAAEDKLRQVLAGGATDTTLEAFRGELQDACALISIATGGRTTDSETFDLHALANDVLLDLCRKAERRALHFQMRIDPATPYRLRGGPRHIARILHNLGMLAIEAGDGPLRLSIDAPVVGARMIRLRFRLRGTSALEWAGPRAVVIEQLVRLVGGELEPTGAGAWSCSAVLPLSRDPVAPEPLDLADRSVLIVTEDSQFAGEFAEPLNHWRADVRWIGGCDAALNYLECSDTSIRPVLIVDARAVSLAALSFIHRSATMTAAVAPFVLLVTVPNDVDLIETLAGDICDAVLSGPDAVALLGNALHALPLGERLPASTTPETASPAPVEPEDRSGHDEERVTPITSHPRFLAEPAAVIDLGMVTALRALARGEDFIGELVQAFQEDARRLMERIGRSIADGDLPAFQVAITALRRCAVNIGANRLSDLAQALRSAGSDDLRQNGTDYAHKLGAELGRLDAALADLLDSPQARQN